MSEAEILTRLDGLARRVAAIESRLGMVRPAAPAPPVPEDAEVSEAVGGIPVRASGAAPAVRPHTPGGVPVMTPVPVSHRSPPSVPAHLGTMSAARERSSRVTIRWPWAGRGWRVPRTREGWEQLVGARWYMVIGALVIVAGLGLVLKIAFDQGWIGQIPPGLRCIGVAVFGFGLLAAGEWARRRISAWACVGLNGAGLGAIYASAYAAYHMGLIGAPVAFALLALSAGLGVAIAARARLVSVAVLSLLGGYLVPLLLAGAEASALVLPAYLVMLLGVGLVLSGWLRGSFGLLRGLVWWGTLVYGGVWMLAEGTSHVAIASVFLCAVWAMIHAELVVSARRADAAGERLRRLVPLIPLPLASSFSVGAWAAGLGIAALMPGSREWAAPAVGAILTGSLSVWLAGALRVLRDPAATNAERLGIALFAQCGAFVVATVALALSSSTEVVAWLGLGVAAALAGRWLGAWRLKVYALAALAIGVGRLLFVDTWHAGLAAGGVDLAGFHLTRWGLLTAISGVAWLVTARLLWAGEGLWRRVGEVCVAIGMTLLGLSLTHVDSSIVSTASVWPALGLAVLVLGRSLRSPGIMWFGMVLLGLGTLGLLAVESTSRPGGVSVLGFSVTTAVIPLLLAAAAWLGSAAVIAREHGAWRAVFPVCVGVGMTLMGAALMHRDSASISTASVWPVVGLAVLVVGRVLRSRALLGYGLLLLGLATLGLVGLEWWARDGVSLAGLHVTTALVPIGLCGAVWLASALIVRDEWFDGRLPFVGSSVAMACVLLGLAHERADGRVVVLLWGAISVGVMAARSWRARLRLDRVGFGGLCATLAAWCLVYAAFGWSRFGWPIATHPGLLTALVLAAVGMFALGRLGMAERPRVMGWARAMSVLLVLVATSLEVARGAALIDEATAQRSAVSIWWGLFGVGLIAAGFWRRVPLARHAGLALLGVATAKAVVLDLAEVPAGWRAVSFIGLGLLMLGVGVVYSKVSTAIRQVEGQETAPDDAN
jgi:uncharacterized membrane protein